MQLWYRFCELIPLEMLHWDFMKNALLAILIMSPMHWVIPHLPELPLDVSAASEIPFGLQFYFP